jgi:hypothetical protein
MPWSKRHLLRINGGPGLDLKRKRPATKKADKLEDLRKRLSKTGLPRSWATILQRRGLRPKALREALGRLSSLREELGQARERMAAVRRLIKETLTGHVEPEPEAVPAPATVHHDHDQDDQGDEANMSAFYDDLD